MEYTDINISEPITPPVFQTDVKPNYDHNIGQFEGITSDNLADPDDDVGAMFDARKIKEEAYEGSLQQIKDKYAQARQNAVTVSFNERFEVDEFGIPLYEDDGVDIHTRMAQLEMPPKSGTLESWLGNSPEWLRRLVVPFLDPLLKHEDPSKDNWVARGMVGGGISATRNMNMVARELANVLGADFDEETWKDIPKLLGESTGTGEDVVNGLTQFLSVFAGLGGFSKGATLLQQTYKGGVADFLFDPEEGNIATAIRSMGVENEFLAYLDSQVGEDADDLERLEARLVQAAEGGVLGVAITKLIPAVVAATKWMKESMLDTDPDSFYKALELLGIKNPQLNLTDISGLPKNAPDIGDMFSNKIEVESVLKEKIDVNQYRKISGGSVRSVYQISNDKVVKVATHPRGLEQNALATDGFLQNNEHWPEVFETGQDYVVAEYVPRNDKVANKYLKPLKEFTAQDWDRKIPELQKAMEEMGLDDFLNYNLLWNDFKSVRNWGVREDGTVVLIDEGAISDQITATSKIDDFTKQAWEDIKQSRKSVPAAAPIAMTQGESDDTSNFIKSFEGYRDEGYYATDAEKDAGIVTAGYGSTRRVAKGEKITEDQAEKYFKEDLAVAEKAVDSLVTVSLTPNQRSAVVSLIFNVGQGNFKKSKALKALNKGDLDTFMKEAFDSKVGFVRSGGKVLKGLVKRREAERKLFEGIA